MRTVYRYTCGLPEEHDGQGEAGPVSCFAADCSANAVGIAEPCQPEHVTYACLRRVRVCVHTQTYLYIHNFLGIHIEQLMYTHIHLYEHKGYNRYNIHYIFFQRLDMFTCYSCTHRLVLRSKASLRTGCRYDDVPMGVLYSHCCTIRRQPHESAPPVGTL